MRNIWAVSMVFLLLWSCQTKTVQRTGLLTKGISAELATYRKQQVQNIRYALQFSIPAELEAPIQSQLDLQVELLDLSEDLYIDFNEKASKLKSVHVNGKSIPIQHRLEHVIIPKGTLKKGENTVQIQFDAGELSLNRNKEFLYTLLVPDRASTLFPCFDQPDLKAKYQLTIKAPEDWKVLCGAFEENTVTKDGYTTHTFRESDLMSTYLFSFVAGKFTEKIKNPGAFPMRFLYRETNPEKIKASVDAVFDIHQKSLDFLVAYTDYKFPYQKMDFASIPPFQYGGMEHVGAIQYRASSLFLDQNATQTRKLNRAKLIAHETSHMWFGDLVTMRWFNDVWMKEVFANFMADKIMNPVFPKINHNLNFMMSHYPSAYSEDRTKGTNPIRQELRNLKNAGSLYGRIIYNKAPIMMRQLEYLVGEAAFQKGIQKYIKTYADDNADWNELVAILDEQSDKDITQWSEIWVNASGRPIFSDRITYADGNIATFDLMQKAEDGSHKVWGQSFDIALVYDKEIKILPVQMDQNKISVAKAIGLPKPKQIIYNYNGFGYGVFPVTAGEISTIQDEVARGYAYINLYENMLNGQYDVLAAYHEFLNGLTVEKNELITNYLSGRIQQTYWKYLAKEPQRKLQSKTSRVVFELLQKDLPANIKRTLFRLYSNIAHDEKGKEHLYQLWNNSLQVANLKLNENDKTNLAMKLAIYGHKNADEILSIQTEKIQNKDRKARFQWLLPTLSDKVADRDAFMRSLKEASNREKESWVATALNNIHHPLRHEESTKHVQQCLELLEEIQLTGDIFFPKSWLSSSIGNYASPKAYTIVQNFLQERPNYNPVMKKKLLQVVDGLERAQKIN